MIEMISALSSTEVASQAQPSVAANNIQGNNYVQANNNVQTNSEIGSRFVDWVSKEMLVVNDQIHTAESNLRDFAAGKTENLHQVMLSLNKAKLSFELMVEVRNKTLEGYQEIMRMQI